MWFHVWSCAVYTICWYSKTNTFSHFKSKSTLCSLFWRWHEKPFPWRSWAGKKPYKSDNCMICSKRLCKLKTTPAHCSSNTIVYIIYRISLSAQEQNSWVVPAMQIEIFSIVDQFFHTLWFPNDSTLEFIFCINESVQQAYKIKIEP